MYVSLADTVYAKTYHWRSYQDVYSPGQEPTDFQNVHLLGLVPDAADRLSHLCFHRQDTCRS